MSAFSPDHGGDILSASQYYQIPFDQWIDLSTGINPYAYPIPQINDLSFQSLPYIQAEFISAACEYYSVDSLVPVAGTQSAINLLPSLLDRADKVLLPDIGYQEHELSWQKQNVTCHHYSALNTEQAVQTIDQSITENNRQHLVVINPNNPSGLFLEPQQLVSWAEKLDKACYVIVDEAFIDVTPESSVLAQDQFPKNIIVLRSFGKFFGLAGVRLGFVIASVDLQQSIEKAQGLWSINGIAQAVALTALRDRKWQTEMREKLEQSLLRRQDLLESLMGKLDLLSSYHHALFSSFLLRLEEAQKIADYFAKQGILLRTININHQQALLRIGAFSLVADNLSRVSQAVKHYSY